MATEVIMPQGGQDITVGKVVRWLKAEGEPVRLGETLCEVETEKAVFDVPSPVAGFLRKIVVPEGSESPIFSVIGYVGDAKEEIPLAHSSSHLKKESASAQSPTRMKAPPGGSPPAGERAQVSPRARRLADEQGVSLELVLGSGPGGRVTEKDVQAFIDRQSASLGSPRGQAVDGGHIVSMSKVQAVTARRLQTSKQTVPHFYLSATVDMTDALRFRQELNAQSGGHPHEHLSVTDLIVRACVLGFVACPELNSSVFDDTHVVMWDELNIGLAVAVNDDLVVPVMGAPSLESLESIARERRALIAKVKEGKQPSLARARFTISNLGIFHIDQFLAIINPPEASILAVSSVQKRPVALPDGSVGIRDLVNLSLSIDHRAVNGVLACRFLNAVKAALEDPASLK